MIILLAYAAVVLLFVLDRMKKIELGHPVWVLLTAAGYFCSTLWTAALTLLALVQTVEGTGVSSLLAWGQAALSALPETGGLLCLISTRSGASSSRSAPRR